MNFAKFVRTLFVEHHGTTASDYAVPIIVKGELANETVNYDTKTKAYVPIWTRGVSYQKRAVLVKFKQVSEEVIERCSLK